RFNDFNRAEGKLTKLLAQKSKGGRTTYDIFEKHMGNLGDKDKEEYLRSKFARATSPLRAIAKDNDALIADLNTTLSTTIEKLNALKKKSPELKDFDEICKKCQKLNPEAVSKKTLVDNLNLLSEYTKKYTAAQNKLRSWRDEIYPVLLEAEKHLETDLITVNRLSGDYERIKKDLRIVFKETTTYLRESGKIQKGKNARKAIDNEIKEIAKRLKKISDMNESATKILTKKPTSAGIGAAFDLNFEKKSFSYGKDTMVCKHDLMANEIANHHKLLIEKLKLQAEMAGKKDKYDIKAELIEYTEKITPLSQDLYDNIRDFTRNTFYQMARQILRSDTHNLGSEALRARENLWRLKDRESNIKDLIKNYKKAMDSELIKLNNYLKILEEEKLLILNNIDSIYK
ncbi:hypothetical protein HN681_00130, partial [archaeon]|nr:hypothetical protein [archaeon]